MSKRATHTADSALQWSRLDGTAADGCRGDERRRARSTAIKSTTLCQRTYAEYNSFRFVRCFTTAAININTTTPSFAFNFYFSFSVLCTLWRKRFMFYVLFWKSRHQMLCCRITGILRQTWRVAHRLWPSYKYSVYTRKKNKKKRENALQKCKFMYNFMMFIVLISNRVI